MNENWDAKKYEQEFDFVYRHGEDLLGLLELEPGEKILDLGCGNGVLSKKIADLGAFVVGVDASEDMLALARNKYPELSFFQKDASNFTMPEQFDAVFSNAVFHWIDNQDGLMESIRSVLRPGGRLVCEFGGYGNCQRIHKALEEAFWEKGLSYRNPFYFPTVGAYAGRLEAHGFLVRFARIFNRKTKLEGENGMENWISMFIKAPFASLPAQTKKELIRDAVGRLRPECYQENSWYADYVRIRLKAEKI